MWSALADLASLPEKLIASIGFLGGEGLHGNMVVLLRNLQALGSFFPVKGGRIRKLVGIADREKPGLWPSWTIGPRLPSARYTFSCFRSSGGSLKM
jgi:hypothetical protein